MKNLQLHDEDLQERVKNETNHSGFQAMAGQQVIGTTETEIWLERQQDDLLDVDDASILYADFSPLPDFPCMSSSSSSSSTPAPLKSIASSASSSSASSSSSVACWAVLRSDAEENVDKKNHHDHHQDRSIDATPPALSSTASMEISQQADGINGIDCMDVMENFRFMYLLDRNDLFNPSSIFNQDEPPLKAFQERKQERQQRENEKLFTQSNNGNSHEKGASEELATLFLEWLKTNKETVSADDLRRIKFKKATIECAARRLGGGKEAMKQLLKLVLEWVQINHLQRRRMRELASNLPNQQYQDPFQNANHDLNANPIQPEPNRCFAQSPWIGQQSYIPDPITVVPGFAPVVGYMGESFANGTSNISDHGYAPQTEYHMLASAQSRPPSQFALTSHHNSLPHNSLPFARAHPQAFTGYGNQIPDQSVQGYGAHGHGKQRSMRLDSSATKEARRKRIARQRRLQLHLRHQQQQHNNYPNQLQNQSVDQHARFVRDNCSPPAQANHGNWVFWPSSAGGTASPLPVIAVNQAPVQAQNYQSQASSDRQQGWKPEKNLRFLLQKVLKQSDVGNLGRIVLPKKEAQTHLPELETRDGISITMEEIGTSRVWNMRYRFWPNNKSRMYLLENTGDFVKANGLQEGDFIVIYSDIKCGKYLIRGVKVRQQPGSKSDAKRPGKWQRNKHTNSPSPTAIGNTVGNGSSSSPIPQTIK